MSTLSSGCSSKWTDNVPKESPKKNISDAFKKRKKEQEKKSLENTKKNLGNYLLSQDCTPLPTKKEITFKVIVVGDYGVGKLTIVNKLFLFYFYFIFLGKTSIIRQYVQGKIITSV